MNIDEIENMSAEEHQHWEDKAEAKGVIPPGDSIPVYPQPANSHDAEWAGAQVGGMTLRQHYAGLAMQGILAANAGKDSPCYDWTNEVIATTAVSLADEMVKALAQIPPTTHERPTNTSGHRTDTHRPD